MRQSESLEISYKYTGSDFERHYDKRRRSRLRSMRYYNKIIKKAEEQTRYVEMCKKR